MTYAQLVDQVRRQCFVFGESESLIAIHDSFFQEAMWDLQARIPCLTANLTDTYAACASYFDCGMTVLPKPNGRILRIYVIDKVNPETGQQDLTGDNDWCQKVVLQQVDFRHLQAAVKLCQRCCPGTPNPVIWNSVFSQFFGIWRRKTTYPTPTDAGLPPLPSLPFGLKYPQESTNVGGRSPTGVYAIYRNRIYIAPWIESSNRLFLSIMA